jgi:hypothetical protein
MEYLHHLGLLPLALIFPLVTYIKGRDEDKEPFLFHLSMWFGIYLVMAVVFLGIRWFVMTEANAEQVQMSASVSENICNSNLEILKACCK